MRKAIGRTIVAVILILDMLLIFATYNSTLNTFFKTPIIALGILVVIIILGAAYAADRYEQMQKEWEDKEK